MPPTTTVTNRPHHQPPTERPSRQPSSSPPPQQPHASAIPDNVVASITALRSRWRGQRIGFTVPTLLLLLLLVGGGRSASTATVATEETTSTSIGAHEETAVGAQSTAAAVDEAIASSHDSSSHMPMYQLHQYEEPSARNGTNSTSGCHLERGCLLCGPDGLCAKCVHFITADAERRCVLECPRGYIEQWSNQPQLLGIVCQPNGYSDPMLATIVSLTIGACACLLLVVGGVLTVRRKQRLKGTRAALIDETTERDDFLKQLDELRPSAEYFLAMLNDTRRQIRKRFLAGDEAGANAYRTVVRDLAKVLILLNRPVELITRPPHDWPRVYSWARRILDRCRPQLAQLIEFLQSPDTADGRLQRQQQSHAYQQQMLQLGGGGSQSQYSTFKSTNTSSTMTGGRATVTVPTVGGGDGSSASSTDSSSDAKHPHHHHHKMAPLQLFGSLISLHELNDASADSSSRQLHPTNPFRSSSGTLKAGPSGSAAPGHHHHPLHPPSGDVHGSSLWLEDEFFKLGFRPQDEITTEL